jgi:hypothetical protein
MVVDIQDVELEDVEVKDFQLQLEDDRTEDGTEEPQVVRYSISSYGADYPVDGLVRRIQNGSIYVPKFQRGFVWDINAGSRFVESLLLGLPIPSVFFSREPISGKLLVVDGQQRLVTLRCFYEGVWAPTNQPFRLKGVIDEFAGCTYSTLSPEDRRRLDDAIIHAIIFKQDEPTEDESGVYQVFERLNTGSKQLTPQEIRNAVHHDGQMRDLLLTLNKNPEWRLIYGPEDARLRDQELILRFLALRSGGSEYEKPMAVFLNKFMGRKRHLSQAETDSMSFDFGSAIATIYKSVGSRAFRPVRALNAAVFDSVMVGTARRLSNGPVASLDQYRLAYEGLLQNEAFLRACGRGTASPESVGQRLRLATGAFQDIQ